MFGQGNDTINLQAQCLWWESWVKARWVVKGSQPKTKYLLMTTQSPKYCFFWATSSLENLVPHQPSSTSWLSFWSLHHEQPGCCRASRGWGRKDQLESGLSGLAAHVALHGPAPIHAHVMPLLWLYLYPMVPFTWGLLTPLQIICSPAAFPPPPEEVPNRSAVWCKSHSRLLVLDHPDWTTRLRGVTMVWKLV